MAGILKTVLWSSVPLAALAGVVVLASERDGSGRRQRFSESVQTLPVTKFADVSPMPGVADQRIIGFRDGDNCFAVRLRKHGGHYDVIHSGRSTFFAAPFPCPRG